MNRLLLEGRSRSQIGSGSQWNHSTSYRALRTVWPVVMPRPTEHIFLSEESIFVQISVHLLTLLFSQFRIKENALLCSLLHFPLGTPWFVFFYLQTAPHLFPHELELPSPSVDWPYNV